MNDALQNGKIMVAVRAARMAVGLNQQEFAEFMDVAKTTIARIETLEMKANADFLLNMVDFFQGVGVKVNIKNDGVVIEVSEQAINTAVDAMKDVNKRRVDRRVKP